MNSPQKHHSASRIDFTGCVQESPQTSARDLLAEESRPSSVRRVDADRTGGRRIVDAHQHPQERLTLSLSRKFYGRESELERLRQIRQIATRKKQRPQVVFVSGQSGCGKSRLLAKAFEQDDDGKRCITNKEGQKFLYGSGKFDDERTAAVPPASNTHSSTSSSTTKLPYAALIHCLSQVCRNMKRHDENVFLNANKIASHDDGTMSYAQLLAAKLSQRELARLVTFLPELLDTLHGADAREKEEVDDDEQQLAQPKKEMLQNNTPTSSELQKNAASPRKAIRSMLSTSSSSSSRKIMTTMTTETSLSALKFAVRAFLRLISTSQIPLILCFDDLQWIDDATLDILQSIVLDSRLFNVIVSGTYREDEVDETHPISRWMNMIHDEINKASSDRVYDTEQQLSIQTLQIGNLTTADLERLLSDLLRIDKDDNTEISSLAELICSRTAGNAFHVMEHIDYLQNSNLLTYCNMSFRWMWDISEIQNQTKLSNNVVAMISARLDKLPLRVRNLLKLCSLLGFRFEEEILVEVARGKEVLELLLPQKSNRDIDSDKCIDVQSCLKIAIEEGLLEKLVDTKRIRFSHDKIFEASVQRLSEDPVDRNRIHLAIGNLMWLSRRDTFTDTDRHLFLCTDQLNRGRQLLLSGPSSIRQPVLSSSAAVADTDPSHIMTKTKLAALNLQTAKQAANYSAFFPAISYLEIAVELLNPESCWLDHYELALEIYTSLAEMCHRAGENVKLFTAANVVLSNSRSIDDSIRVHMVLIDAKTSGSLDHEILPSHDLLELLGEKIPAKPANRYQRRLVNQTKRKILKMSDEDIRSLPDMTDTRKAACVHIYSLWLPPMFSAGNHALASVAACRSLQLTLDYGIAPESTTAVALFGTLVLDERDGIDAAYKLYENTRSRFFDSSWKVSRSRYTALASVICQFRIPLSMSLDDLIEGHRDGMRNGDMFGAFWNTCHYGFSYFYSGLPLSPLLRDLEDFLQLKLECRQKFWLLNDLALHQAVVNLTGNSDDILDMERGRVVHYRDKVGWENRESETVGWSYRMQIAVYCEDWDLAMDLAKKLQTIPAGIAKPAIFNKARVFFYALINSMKEKMTRKRKHRRASKQYYNEIKDWVVKKRSINLVHKLQILHAFRMSVAKRANSDELSKGFDSAIAASTRSGFLQDAALAAHLAFQIFQEIDGKVNQGRARSYLERALELYASWGATGVVDYISRKHAGLISLPEGSSTSISSQSFRRGFRARQRYDNSLRDTHKDLNVDF